MGSLVEEEESPSLPFAAQYRPPVVRPGVESPLGGVDSQVLIVAGGKQDVLPGWFGLDT